MATREDRIFWQSLKICPVCEKNHLYNGEKNCIECKAKASEYNARSYMRHKEELKPVMAVRNRNLYHKRKEEGLCTRCGSKNVKPGTTMCYQCLIKTAEIKKRSRDRLKGGGRHG